MSCIRKHSLTSVLKRKKIMVVTLKKPVFCLVFYFFSVTFYLLRNIILKVIPKPKVLWHFLSFVLTYDLLEDRLVDNIINIFCFIM